VEGTRLLPPQPTYTIASTKVNNGVDGIKFSCIFEIIKENNSQKAHLGENSS
jgi:hypothetical protein